MSAPPSMSACFQKSDILVLGEFCEKLGPCATELYFSSSAELDHISDQARDRITPALNAFMMRAMSGDHVFGERSPSSTQRAGGSGSGGTSGGSGGEGAEGGGNGNGGGSEGGNLLQHRPCEVLLDNVAWVDGEPLVAFVYSFTLPDVRARGYTRTVCLSYLTADEQKMFTIVPWLSREFQGAAEEMFTATLEVHRRELMRAMDAVERCFSGSLADSSRLTPRNMSGLAEERESLRRRAQRTLGSSSAFSIPGGSKTKKRIPGMAAMLSGSPSIVSFDSLSEVSHTIPDSPSAPHSAVAPVAAAAAALVGAGCGGDGSTSSNPPSVSTLCSPHGIPVQRAPFCPSPGSSPPRGLATMMQQGGAPQPTTSPPLLTDDECVAVVDQLITLKGSQPLRPLRELCGDAVYDAVLTRVSLALQLFGQDTVSFMELVLQLMRPVRLLMEDALTDCFHAKASKPSQFFFKIGDYICVDPALGTAPSLPPFYDRIDRRTALHDEDLYPILRERGAATITNVAFNALRCTTVVVCGTSRSEVERAMRIAATFIPGLWQTRHHLVALIGFGGEGGGGGGTGGGNQAKAEARVTFEHLLRYSLVGCPPSAILDPNGGKEPLLENVFVWEVVRNKKGQYADVLHGGRRYVTDKRRQLASNSTAIAHGAAAAGGGDVGSQLSNAMSYSVVGLLTELFDLLSVRSPVNAEEDVCLTNYTRLLLKRIFHEYGSMAALVVHTMAALQSAALPAPGADGASDIVLFGASAGASCGSPTPHGFAGRPRSGTEIVNGLASSSGASPRPPGAGATTTSTTTTTTTTTWTTTMTATPASSGAPAAASTVGTLPAQSFDSLGGHGCFPPSPPVKAGAHTDPFQSPPLLANPHPTGPSSLDDVRGTAGAAAGTATPLLNTMHHSSNDLSSINGSFTGGTTSAATTVQAAGGSAGASGQGIASAGTAAAAADGGGIPQILVSEARRALSCIFVCSEQDVRELLELKLGYPSPVHSGDVAIVTQLLRRMLQAWHHSEVGAETGGGAVLDEAVPLAPPPVPGSEGTS